MKTRSSIASVRLDKVKGAKIKKGFIERDSKEEDIAYTIDFIVTIHLRLLTVY